MASNQNKAPHRSGINGNIIGAIFLGICILIAGINIGGGIRKLNKTMSEKTFADSNTYNVPENMSFGQKKYLTEDEAAEYLNLSKEEIVNLITSGEINEYVRTSKGYSISADVLDSWFDNAAYQNTLGTTETSEKEE
ncbi:MAG: excisionase family DNA-binding protein [Oscillospiraceae bacterium]|nr:excisionase family DNA-binding protein [Oscillospiraceae bacterium]